MSSTTNIRRSDFDKLSVYDVAVCCSHVNSYPLARKSGTFRPIEAAAASSPGAYLMRWG